MATLAEAAKFALAEMDREHPKTFLIAWENGRGEIEHRTWPHESQVVMCGMLRQLVRKQEDAEDGPRDDE